MDKTWRVHFKDGHHIDLDDDQAEEFRQLTWTPGNEFRKMPEINNKFLISKVTLVEKIIN